MARVIEAHDIGGIRHLGAPVPFVMPKEHRRFVRRIKPRRDAFGEWAIGQGRGIGNRQRSFPPRGPGITPPFEAHLCSPCSSLVVESIAFGQGRFRSLQGIHDSFGERRSLKRRFLQVFLPQPAIWSALEDQCDVICIPAGMDHAHIAKVEEQGKGQKPRHHFGGSGTPNRKFVDEGPMLVDVLGHMRSHVAVGHVQPVLALAVEMQGIQFVIAHDGHGIAVLHHGAHQFDDLSVAGTGVDEVTEEGRQPAIGMLPTATGRVVAESVQRGFQPIDVGVDVGNDVVSRYGQISFRVILSMPHTSQTDARGI